MGADSAGLANADTAFSSGASGVGSNSFGFSLPDGAASGGSDPLAGLSGIQSGMSLPGASGVGSNSFGFGMPAGGGFNIASLAGPLGGASKQLSAPSGGQLAPRGGGGVSLRAQNFVAPVSSTAGPAGSPAGQSLIELLQKYQVGRAA